MKDIYYKGHTTIFDGLYTTYYDYTVLRTGTLRDVCLFLHGVTDWGIEEAGYFFLLFFFSSLPYELGDWNTAKRRQR